MRKQINHSVRAICVETLQCAYTIVHSVVWNWRNVYSTFIYNWNIICTEQFH